MAHEGAIVQRHEGKTIDEEFLKLVGKEFDTYVGFVAFHNGELITQFWKEIDEAITDIQDTAKDVGSFAVIFGKGISEEEDRQPLRMMSTDNSSEMVAIMLEGNFSGSGYEAPVESSHPDEFYVIQGYLLPKMTNLAQQFDENIAQMVEYLNGKFNQNEILKSICPLPGARCEVLFYFANGQTVNLVKGDLHKQFDWGETSQALSYAPIATAANGKDKPLSLKEKLAKNTGSVPVVKPKADTAIGAALKVAEANKKEDDRPYIKPPGRRCDSAKNLGNWYDHYAGYRPESWEDGIKHSDKAPVARVKKELWDNQIKWTEAVSKNSVIVVKGDKAPGVVHPSGGSKIENNLLTASEREGLIKVFKPKLVKSIDDKSSFVDDPVKIAEELRTRELLTEALPGLFPAGIAECFGWGPDAHDALQKQNPEAYKLLCREAIYRLYIAFGQLRDKSTDRKSATM
jgi:hypothetical protein